MNQDQLKSFEDLVPKQFKDIFKKESFDQLVLRRNGTMLLTLFQACNQ